MLHLQRTTPNWLRPPPSTHSLNMSRVCFTCVWKGQCLTYLGITACCPPLSIGCTLCLKPCSVSSKWQHSPACVCSLSDIHVFMHMSTSFTPDCKRDISVEECLTSAREPVCTFNWCLFLEAIAGSKHGFDIFYQSSLWKTALMVV